LPLATGEVDVADGPVVEGQPQSIFGDHLNSGHVEQTIHRDSMLGKGLDRFKRFSASGAFPVSRELLVA
jgi:hypothetical protein